MGQRTVALQLDLLQSALSFLVRLEIRLLFLGLLQKGGCWCADYFFGGFYRKGYVDVQSTFLEAFTERNMLMCNLFLWRLLQKGIC
jgi:hypothetical protein